MDNNGSRTQLTATHGARSAGASDLVSTRRADYAREALARASRIVILTKFRFMGDTVVATPFMRQLKGHVPDSKIDLIAAPTVVDALANCPYLERIIPINMSSVSRIQHGKDLFGKLKEGGYDVAFVLNRSLHCAVTTAIARTPVRIGYANELRRFLLTVPIPYFFDRNEVDCHLDMLRSIGLTARHALPELWITDAEQNHARELLVGRGCSIARPIIGIQPGANDPYIREWGAEKYAAAADRLANEMDAQFVLMGGVPERETANAVAKLMKSPPINLVGELELRDALATIGLCSLWMGNDTGLLHSAVAQRVPSVGVYGPNKVVRWGYDSPRHRSLVSFPETPADNDAAVRKALDAIPVSDMLDAARAVMSAPAEPEAANSARSKEEAADEPAPYFAATIRPATTQIRRR